MFGGPPVFQGWSCVFSSGPPGAEGTSEKEHFPVISLIRFFMHKDVFPAIGALLGSNTVGQMLIPILVPAAPPVRFLVQRLLHVVFPGPAFSF